MRTPSQTLKYVGIAAAALIRVGPPFLVVQARTDARLADVCRRCSRAIVLGHGTNPWFDSSPALGVLALLYGFARAVPDDTRVVAVGVQVEHRFDDVLDGLLLLDDFGEVAQVLL